MQRSQLYKTFFAGVCLLLADPCLHAQTPVNEIQSLNTESLASIWPCASSNTETENTSASVQRTTLSNTGIAEIQGVNIKAYIFNKTLFVQLNNGYVSSGELKIYSLRGMEVYSKMLNEPNHKIDLSSLTQGIYVIKIQNGNTITSKKILVD